MAKKRVAIIGAGASGITAIKCCLDEELDPCCFELTDDIGGLWNFKATGKPDNLGSVMKSTVINTSKEMMCYSDFPIPKEYPAFMHNTKVLEYFRLYVRNFGLEKYIQFGTRVKSVKQDDSGVWSVKFSQSGQTEVQEEHFDAVLVCTGHHGSKNTVSFPGEESFQGRCIHSHEYLDQRGYEDKRVVIVGIGNSGGDIAVELSKISSQVYLSTRSKSWILPRSVDGGVPMDMQFTTRFRAKLAKALPLSFASTAVEKFVNKKFDHELYGLKPKHNLVAQHPMVNDDLPNRILAGSVIIKPNIEKISQNGVHFEDGSYEDNIDVIIYATGYKFGFPFVEHPELQVKNNKLKLYKYMFPPTLDTLAAIGYVQPLGAVMPISELQCRLATRVFKGLIKLPGRDERLQDIVQKEAKMAARYTCSKRHTIQVDFVHFMDELAEMVGCKPGLGRLLMSDPVLAKEVLLGPCSPYQYRLQGPGSWSGARKAILSQWHNTFFGLGGQASAGMNESNTRSAAMKLIIFVLVLALLVQVILR